MTGRSFIDSTSNLGRSEGRNGGNLMGLLWAFQALVFKRPAPSFLPLLYPVSPHYMVCLINGWWMSNWTLGVSNAAVAKSHAYILNNIFTMASPKKMVSILGNYYLNHPNAPIPCDVSDVFIYFFSEAQHPWKQRVVSKEINTFASVFFSNIFHLLLVNRQACIKISIMCQCYAQCFGK